MKPFAKTVILTGLFVGTTDILAAYISQWIKTGQFAEHMLNYIGGGLIGLENSMNSGNWGALLGLVNHYAIAMFFTLLFFLVFPKVKILRFDKYLIGILYAMFIGVVMNFIVLPLTPLPGGKFSLPHEFVGWIILGIVLGIPISYKAYEYYGIE